MRRLLAVAATALIALVTTTEGEGKGGPCAVGMAHVAVEGKPAYCIDRWENAVVEVAGKTQTAHPANKPVTKLDVMAVTKSGVTPQGYISKTEAESACKRAKKRLCTAAEWDRACRGKTPTLYPYGDEKKDGYCNDSGKAAVASYESSDAMNDPKINEAPNTVAPTGSFTHCRNAFGVYDMVGNLHEWVADVHDGTRGTFRGGYYQDTHINGDGCNYKTTAHDVAYHDYSTGFRCCSDAK